MRKPRGRPRFALTILFSALIFAILFITMIIVSGIAFLLSRVDFLRAVFAENVFFPVFVLALASILVGTFVGAVMSRIPLRPMSVLISGMARLAGGDYAVRISLGKVAIAQKMADSFNTLAAELENTEILRADFVNDFSHEFKTPIVSIRGFAKLLQKGGLSREQEQEYLAIIAQESGRLSDMATSVLNLAKVENQSILTDVIRINLSEQIRNCLLLLEKKWSGKELAVTADFGEFFIWANEELLRQVFINLIDNAIKFSDKHGEVSISITQNTEDIEVSIKNHGLPISEEDKKRIFNKFYQADSSHASEGTGLGLAIARRIVVLHKGDITVASSAQETVFTVRLPGGPA